MHLCDTKSSACPRSQARWKHGMMMSTGLSEPEPVSQIQLVTGFGTVREQSPSLLKNHTDTTPTISDPLQEKHPLLVRTPSFSLQTDLGLTPSEILPSYLMTLSLSFLICKTKIMLPTVFRLLVRIEWKWGGRALLAEARQVFHITAYLFL